MNPSKFLYIIFLLLPVTPIEGNAKTIHEEKSLYRNIAVRQTDNRRCLVFPSGKKDREQSCVDVSDPDRLIFPYVRMTFAGLLLNPSPKNILVIGLGGGSIPTTLSHLYPEATVDAVEIDPAVLRVAEQFFNFKETDKLKVHLVDARVYVKRSLLTHGQFDLIILDAFNGDYIPEHLMTTEFLKEVQNLLSDDGVVVANTFSSSRLYDHESVTYHEVFGDFYNFRLPVTGNRIILASKQTLPDLLTIKKRVSLLKARLKKYGVNIDKYPRYMKTGIDWDDQARPLTDQYSPANLLQGD